MKVFLSRLTRGWALFGAAVLVFTLGLGSGVLLPRFVPQLQTAVAPAASGIDLSIFWEVWNALDKKYDGSLTAQQKLDAAISGLAGGLGDPYTVYLPPAAAEEFAADISGVFGGIGAELEMVNGNVTVVAPLAGTPAERAGIIPGDVITHVDDVASTGKSLDSVVKTIRGEPGTTVTLTISRPSEIKPVSLTITRDTIKVESVKSERLADGAVSYIRLTQFRDTSSDQVREVLTAAVEDGAEDVILDLRNNPGGLVTEAQKVAGLFIPKTVSSDDVFLRKRVVVRERTADGQDVSSLSASGTPVFPEGRLIILMNAGSASASEIVAGALRDYGRATIIGEQSFGKGSVQELVPLQNEGSLKVTIARWFTPKGVGIDKDGVTPDTVVEQSLEEKLSTTDQQVKAALQALGR